MNTPRISDATPNDLTKAQAMPTYKSLFLITIKFNGFYIGKIADVF